MTGSSTPTRPSASPGSRGRPRRHGQRFKCSDPATWPEPDEHLASTDVRYGTVTVGLARPAPPARPAWPLGRATSSPRSFPAPWSACRCEHLPKPTSRTKKTLWLWVAGPDPDLDTCWRAYLRRFDIEHTYRFVKNTLGWTTPRWCTPEQADRWTWIVIAVYTQLRLARGLVADERLPWERQRKPGRLTPARVRRGFRRLAPTLGTPASPPKPSRAGPGRPKGTRRGTPHPLPSGQEGRLTRFNRKFR